jgi:hypothetical protein
MTQPCYDAMTYRAVSLFAVNGEFWHGHLINPHSNESWTLFHNLAADHLQTSCQNIRLVETPSSAPDPVCIMALVNTRETSSRQITLISLSEEIWRGTIHEIEGDAGTISFRSMRRLRALASRHFRVLSKHIQLVVADHDLSEPIVVTACADLRPLQLRSAAFEEWRNLVLPPPLQDSSDDEVIARQAAEVNHQHRAFTDSSDSSSPDSVFFA